jgi:hypothetical protein
MSGEPLNCNECGMFVSIESRLSVVVTKLIIDLTIVLLEDLSGIELHQHCPVCLHLF